jgi:hypothetical protein
MGDFSRVHPLPGSSADVPDDLDARLVVLGIDHAYSKEIGNAAEVTARDILENRGNAPRHYRNALVFLAPDKTRIQDLDTAVRKYLAWDSILGEKETLDLSPHQVKQAETQKGIADSVVTARIPETYQWLLVPKQTKPQAPLRQACGRGCGVRWRGSERPGRRAGPGALAQQRALSVPAAPPGDHRRLAAARRRRYSALGT